MGAPVKRFAFALVLLVVVGPYWAERYLEAGLDTAWR